MAEPDSSVAGPRSSPASVRASRSVPFVRLSSISRLRAAVQRLSPMPAPARWTTASTPSRAAASILPAAGSQRTARGSSDGRRPTGRTTWPSPRSAVVSAEPIRPLAPVTAMSIQSSSWGRRCGCRRAVTVRRQPRSRATHREVHEVPKVLSEFKDFISRGNVIDLAAAVVIGTAFVRIVNAIVAGLLTPLIGMIFSKDFGDMTFTVNDSVFRYGDVINAILQFLAVAVALFFLVVKPINVLNE